MNVRLHILNASGVFDVVSKYIEDEFANSLRRISDMLSISDVDVVLYNNPKGVIPEVGIGGYSPNGHADHFDREVNESMAEARSRGVRHYTGKK